MAGYDCYPAPEGFVRYLVSGPAVDRLGWILDGLNGAADWGSDAADVRARVHGARAAGCVHRAGSAGAEFRVIVCACSDRKLHRTRLEHRERGIPGWHEGGNWANVERRLAEFPPWTGEVLTIDAVQPLAQNLATVFQYVSG